VVFWFVTTCNLVSIYQRYGVSILRAKVALGQPVRFGEEPCFTITVRSEELTAMTMGSTMECDAV
jgi:hypothetical protein